MTSHAPSYKSHDGFLMPMGFPVDRFVSGLEYRAQAGDVFEISATLFGRALRNPLAVASDSGFVAVRAL